MKTIRFYRECGIPVSRVTAKATILGTIRALEPKLLEDHPKFQCSDKFITNTLASYLNYTYRTATRAVQKAPADWEKQCEDAFLRLVAVIRTYRVPPELVLNADQTGLCLIPTGNKTWAEKGAKQVDVFGKEEKRQFTLMVATSAAGDILPFQSIHKGKTAGVLPGVRYRTEGEELGIRWVPGGQKHWSSFKSMVKVRPNNLLGSVDSTNKHDSPSQWIEDIVVPYTREIKKRLGLPERQRSALFIDCWSVHRGEEFRSYMKKHHQNIRILFIPGGCTDPHPMQLHRTNGYLIRHRQVSTC